ncbi:MAG: hypothetical protein FJ241_02140 [Nitrospira sp.]|nr:hypothetical protein [Nitrospira sp.]
MLRSVIGIYNGNKLELKEKVEVKEPVDVLVTFLKETDFSFKKKFLIKRLLNRKPIRITPLKVKDLIEEGRKQI